MRCPECDEELEDGAAFCTRCGMDLSKLNEKPEEVGGGQPEQEAPQGDNAGCAFQPVHSASEVAASEVSSRDDLPPFKPIDIAESVGEEEPTGREEPDNLPSPPITPVRRVASYRRHHEISGITDERDYGGEAQDNQAPVNLDGEKNVNHSTEERDTDGLKNEGEDGVSIPPEKQKMGQKEKVLSAVFAAVAIVALVLMGFFTNWFGLPAAISAQFDNDVSAGAEDVVNQQAVLPAEGRGEAVDSETKSENAAVGEDGSLESETAEIASGDEGDIPIRESLEFYTWGELSQISKKISQAAGIQGAISIAHKYNLCGPNGELSTMPAKVVELSNGTQLHVRIIGFNHDRLTNGGTAGISFVFDEAVTKYAWKQTGFNDGGWQASSVRSWLSMTFFEALPKDLSDVILTVDKPSNNYGGVDEGTIGASVVTASSDKLWLLSYVEMAGSAYENAHWSAEHYGAEFEWCNDVTNAEGSQYALFSEIGTAGFSPNQMLERSFEGVPTRWWTRTSNPHFSNVTLSVAESGSLDDDAGSIESLGVVPGFCI